MEDFDVASDSMELETKRKEDSSWHACRVSLSHSRDGLIVKFSSQELEDIVLKKNEVLTRLRFQSMPLQVDDCGSIEEGVRVMVNSKTEFENVFRDAEVEKVDRVRHSKRGCRCTFLIKWLDNELKGERLSVPSSAIMKLATKSIITHPIVRLLLKPEKDAGLLHSSPLLAILDGNYAEMDLNKLLEEQLEKITNNAAEKDFAKDILWRNKIVINEQAPNKPTAESKACLPAAPNQHNQLKRITRSKSRPKVDIEAKEQSSSTTSKMDIEAKEQSSFTTSASIQEGFVNYKSPLSPLASRAALASALLTTKKCLDADFAACMTPSLFRKGKHSSEILAFSFPLVSEASQVISPFISTHGDASFKTSFSVPTKIWGNEEETSEKVNPNSEASASKEVALESVISGVANPNVEPVTAECSISRAKKSTHQSFNASQNVPVRVTCAATQKGAVAPNDCIQVNICSDGTKRGMPREVKDKKLSKSVNQGNENFSNEEENSLAQVADIDSSEAKSDVPKRNVATKTRASTRKCKDANDRSSQGQKRKAVPPSDQELRFSPRKFPPRTRSQTKV